MKKRNVFFIMTDQQRWDCMGRWNDQIKTPAIDALARQGVLFDQAVCQCPMCVPSRNSMMFGLYPSQLGVRSNAGGIRREDRLPAAPLPQLFSDAGYFCAGFGKTHWNHGKGQEHPSRRGFDIRVEGQPRKSAAYEDGAVMMDDEGQDPQGLRAYFDEVRDYGSGEENYLGYLGCTSRLKISQHRDGFVHAKCLEFLAGELPDQPLFLYFSTIKPHAGFNVPPEFEALYRLEDIPDLPAPPWESEPDTHVRAVAEQSESLRGVHLRRREAWQKLTGEQRRRTTLRYWANCSFMDSLIGDVLNKARERGLLKDALIVFCSDHGEMMGERDHRFSKYCLFDSSVRVPLLLCGDAVDPALHGTVDSRAAGLIDIVPTLCAAAGIACDPRLPGLDLLSQRKRAGSFCEFHGGGSESVQLAPAWMWRTQRYKLIVYRQGTVLEETPPKGELYDLRADPGEWYNLYDDPAHRETKLTLMEQLLSHIATAYAKGPAFWDNAGLGKLGGEQGSERYGG